MSNYVSSTHSNADNQYDQLGPDGTQVYQSPKNIDAIVGPKPMIFAETSYGPRYSFAPGGYNPEYTQQVQDSENAQIQFIQKTIMLPSSSQESDTLMMVVPESRRTRDAASEPQDVLAQNLLTFTVWQDPVLAAKSKVEN